MARRILYNPADFINASTPYYDNLIGTITDQTERIARNLAKREEAEAIAEQRAFEVGLAQMQIAGKQALQEDQQEFSSAEAEKQRIWEQTEASKERELDWADLEFQYWKEGQRRVRVAKEQFEDQRSDIQSRVDKMHEQLKQGGWVGTDGSSYLHVGYDQERDIFTVEDLRTPTESAPSVTQWMGDKEQLLGISRTLTGGGNMLTWIDNNTYDAEEHFGGASQIVGEGEVVEDTIVDGEGNIGLGRDALRRAFVSVRDGVDFDGRSRQLLERVADQDSKYFVLEKEDDLIQFDQSKITDTVSSAKMALTNLDQFYGNLINVGEGTFNYPVDDEKLKMLYPNPIDVNTTLIGSGEETMIPGKSIFELRKSQYALKQEFGSLQMESGAYLMDDQQYKGISNAISNLENLALETIQEYKDSIVPQELKNKSNIFLARAARINANEFRKENPNIKNLFQFPTSGSEEAKALAEKDEFDLGKMQQEYKSQHQLRQELIKQGLIPKKTVVPGDPGYNYN